MGLFTPGHSTLVADTGEIGFGDIYRGSLELFRMEDKSISRTTMISPRIGAQIDKARQLAPDLFKTPYQSRLNPALSFAQQTQNLAAESATFNQREDIYFNHVDNLKQRFPDARFMNMDEIYDDAGQAILTRRQAQASKERHASPAARGFGALAGTLQGAMEDPVNILSMLLFKQPASTFVGKVAFTGGVVAGSEAVIQPSVYGFKQDAGVPYSVEQALGNIALAGLGGGLLEGMGHGLAKAYRAAVRRGRIVETPHTEAAVDRIEALQDTVDEATGRNTVYDRYRFFFEHEPVDDIKVTQPLQPTQEAIESVRKQGVSDRFAASYYRDVVRIMADDLAPHGDVVYLKDEFSRITGRTKSINPDWFQNNDNMASVGYVRDTVEKALAGKSLGKRQVNVIESLMDEWDALRGDAETASTRYAGAADPNYPDTASLLLGHKVKPDSAEEAALMQKDTTDFPWDEPDARTVKLQERVQALARAEADLEAGRPVHGDEPGLPVSRSKPATWDEYQRQRAGSPATFKPADGKSLWAKTKGLFKKDDDVNTNKTLDEPELDMAEAEARIAAGDQDLPDVSVTDSYGNVIQVPAKVAMTKSDREVNAVTSLLECIK